jgi:L-rhamnonate dehydratase
MADRARSAGDRRELGFMFRLSGGRSLHAAAAIDCALWDIRGKADGAPVYELLGSPKQDGIVPYVGTVGVSVETAKARQTAMDLQQAGFVAQKWYPPCSVGHGRAGYEKNVSWIGNL